MLEFFHSLHWYELVIGLVAAGILGYFVFGLVMLALFTFLFYYFTNENFGRVTTILVLCGAAYYLFHLITKYT